MSVFPVPAGPPPAPPTRRWFLDAAAAAFPGSSCPLPVLVGEGPAALAIEVPLKWNPRTRKLGWVLPARQVMFPVGGVRLGFKVSVSMLATASPKWADA